MAARETPPNTPSDEEIAVLKALTKIDRAISQAAPHVGQKPGEALATWLTAIIERETGSDI